MKFELKIESGNAAFSGHAAHPEVERLLRSVADEVALGNDGGPLMESNGNRCGSWFMDDEADTQDCDGGCGREAGDCARWDDSDADCGDRDD